MGARLRKPFLSLSWEDYIASSGAGQIFAVGQTLVLKCRTVFDEPNPGPGMVDRMEESEHKMVHDKEIHSMLMKNRHPHIVCAIMCIPEGIFMPRMGFTLEDCLTNPALPPALPTTQARWIRQLVNAVAFLGSLGYAHGDLRPSNIIFDAKDDLQLINFDSTVKMGQELVSGLAPFIKLSKDFMPDSASAVSEQFALASCMYTIRFWHAPWHDLDDAAMVHKIAGGQLPSASADTLFGDVIHGCWQGLYPSLAALEEDVLCRIKQRLGPHDEKIVDPVEDAKRIAILKMECEEFLAREKVERMRLS